MKTLKDKEEKDEVSLFTDGTLCEPIIYSEDLKQAIKDLKEELKNNKINKRRTNNQIINKIMGEWKE